MKTVLIIEDDLITSASLLYEISKYDEVLPLHAKTYKEAVKLLRSHHKEICFAIVDLTLPDANVNQVVPLIKQHKIPNIILSASIDKNVKELIMDTYVVDYVLKNNKKAIPYAVDRMVKQIKKYDGCILIVDDSSVYRENIRHALEHIDMEILEAKDGQEAFKIIKDKKNNIRLLITDNNMPKMTGLELIMNVRSIHHKDELHIIAISSLEDRSEVTKFLKVGANDFIIKPFNQEEISVNVQAGLETLDLFTTIREQANRDFLTGAFNRRYFFDAGTAMLNANRRKGNPIAVVMVDIDHFKKVNDTYGHEVGDMVIKESVNILHKSLRSHDLVARIGGEEFALLLESITEENTQMVLEKIRTTFEKSSIDIQSKKIQFTVSMGVYYGHNLDLEHAINKADEALYTSKKNGRNQITLLI
jgi:diguanylate cyclase (GGDEF)-like protein